MSRVEVIGNATLYLGDCLEILRALPEDSVDSIVTDPPYGLGKEPDAMAMLADWLATGHHDVKGTGFMGKDWDAFVPQPALWRECLRVLKPGGHLLAFAGTRTHDLMTLGLRIAGFEIRDTIMWVYGSGFPKSLDVSKAIDKAAGAEREVVRSFTVERGGVGGVAGWSQQRCDGCGKTRGSQQGNCRCPDSSPATPDAERWQGWGTALKPALEPITVARKPLAGTVAANVLAHGTGALNIDGCRVGDTVETWPATRSYAPGKFNIGVERSEVTQAAGDAPPGRWPANLIHDGSDEVVALFPANRPGMSGGGNHKPGYEGGMFGGIDCSHTARADTGSAARFFYCAKASKSDRGDGNKHPTVKPTALMAYLCRLVTPPGGVVLDPFMGSGSTGKAAVIEGFRFIGIEREPKYFDIASRRIDDAQLQERLIA